jgi:hypothetical protein
MEQNQAIRTGMNVLETIEKQEDRTFIVASNKRKKIPCSW